jgi:hypothetical protein
MTQLEKRAIETLIDTASSPTVSREHVVKLDSADFKLGWRLAHERFAEILRFFMTASTADLRRYARR